MKVSEALADAFAGEDVSAIFALMGDGNMDWLSAFEKHPTVRVYDVRHEGAGLAMADGWSRVTGKPGVMTVTHGPGVAQLPTSLIVASRNRSPVVIFAGDRPDGDSHTQTLDQRRLVEASECGFVKVASPEVAHDAVRKAFYLARTQSRPIVLDAPVDVQEMEFDGPETYEPSTSVLPRMQRISPDAAGIAEAANIIMSSKKPVIIAGRGAIAAGAQDAIVSVAERIGALISTTLLAKGWLAEQPFHAGICGLFASGAAVELLAGADCVIGVGASLNKFTIEDGYLFSDARFIQIDCQPQVLMGTGKAADCYLQGDARVTLEALNELLAKANFKATGLRTPPVQQMLRRPIDTKHIELDPGCVDPREAARLLDARLADDVGLVIGSGASSAFPTMLMNRPRWPIVAGKPFACIGQAMGIGIGATIAAKRPMLVTDGDASFMMHIQELDTIRRYNLPLMFVILNDEALGAEYHKMGAKGMNRNLALISTPDFGAVARSFGCNGYLARSIEELSLAIDDFNTNRRPTLVDLRISRTVRSLPYRRLHFGEADEVPEAAASGAAAS